jgi:transcriptional regulator with XRE-family HTH domain
MRGNMRAERVRHGMTLEEAAKVAGMHPNTLGKWERGEADPLAENLVRLARLYGCTPEYLLDLTDDRETATAR